MSEPELVENTTPAEITEEAPLEPAPEIVPTIETTVSAPALAPEPAPPSASVPALEATAPQAASSSQPVPIKNNPSQGPHKQHRVINHITPQYEQQNGGFFDSIVRKIKSVAGIGSNFNYQSRNNPHSRNPHMTSHYNGVRRGPSRPQVQPLQQPQHQYQSQPTPQIQQPLPLQSQPLPPQPQPQPQINPNHNIQIHQQKQQLEEMNYIHGMRNGQYQQMIAALMGNGIMGGGNFFQQQQQAQILMTMMMMDQQYQQYQQYQQQQLQQQQLQQQQLQQLQYQQQLQQQFQLQQVMAANQITSAMFENPNNNMMTFNDGISQRNQNGSYRARQNTFFYDNSGYDGSNQSYYQNPYHSEWGNRGYYPPRHRSIYPDRIRNFNTVKDLRL